MWKIKVLEYLSGVSRDFSTFFGVWGTEKIWDENGKKKKILKIFKCLQIDIQLKTNNLPCDRAGMFFPLFLSS